LYRIGGTCIGKEEEKVVAVVTGLDLEFKLVTEAALLKVGAIELTFLRNFIDRLRLELFLIVDTVDFGSLPSAFVLFSKRGVEPEPKCLSSCGEAGVVKFLESSLLLSLSVKSESFLEESSGWASRGERIEDESSNPSPLSGVLVASLVGDDRDRGDARPFEEEGGYWKFEGCRTRS